MDTNNYKKLKIMHFNDQRKIMKDGYTILRPADHPSPRINVLTEKQNWQCRMKFETKAARDREVKRIIENEPKMIFD